MKILKFQNENHENHENPIMQCEKLENHINLKIPDENHENHENHRMTYEKQRKQWKS